MTRITKEEIAARESVFEPLEKPYDDEAWLVSYEQNAYEDQLGISHWAHVVHDRVVVHLTEAAPQYEYYGEKFYERSIRRGRSDDGRVWEYRPELVSYSGGGYWRCVEDVAPAPGWVRDHPKRGYWQRPPYRPRGYMLPDGTPATKLLEKAVSL